MKAPTKIQERQASANASRSAAAARRRTAISQILLFLLVLTFDLIVRRRDVDDKSIDFQVIARLAIWIVAFGWTMLQVKTILPFLKVRQAWPWLALLIWFAVTAIWSPFPALTLVSSFSLLTTLLFIFHCLSVLGERRTLVTILYAITTLLVLSILVYFAIPSFGHGTVSEGIARVSGARMSGVTNQPNVAGSAAGLGLIISIAYFRRFAEKGVWLPILFIGVGVASLVLTQSRTTAVSLLFALGCLWVLRKNLSWALPFVVAAGAFFLLVAIPNAAFLAANMSRTGNAEEIFTATNRVYIWKLVVWLIEQKPLIGWGYDTASQVMSLHVMDVVPELKGYTPPHAHDAFLQVLYSGGGVALVLFAVGLVTNLAALFTLRAWAALSILAFWVVSTLTEAAGLSGVASVATVTTLLPVGLGCLYVVNAPRAKQRQAAPPQRRSVSPPNAALPRRAAPGPRTGRTDRKT